MKKLRCYALLISVSALICSGAAAQDNAKKVKIPAGSELSAKLDDTEAKKKTAPQEGWRIVSVEVNYDPYITRMKELLAFAEPRLKAMENKTATLESEYAVQRKKLDDLLAEKSADYLRARDNPAQKEEIYKIIDARDVKIKAQRDVTLNLSGQLSDLSLQLESTKIGIMKLNQFINADKDKTKSARALIQEITFANDTQKSLEAHLKVDQDTLGRIKATQELFKQQAEEAEKTSKELEQKAADFDKNKRQPLIDKSSKAQAVFIEKYEAFDAHTDYEGILLGVSQIGLDSAEVFIEGKNPLGMLIEIGTKAADAAYTYMKDPGDDRANRQWKVYDSTELIKQYANTDRSSTKTFYDRLKQRATFQQFGKTIAISVMSTIGKSNSELFEDRKQVIKQVMDAMKNSPVRFQGSYSKSFLEAAMKEGEKALAKLNKELLESQIRYALTTTGQGIVYQQLGELEKRAAEKITKSIALATMEQQARKQALRKVETTIAKMAAEANGFKIENYFKSGSKFFDNPNISGKKIVGGMFTGMVWEGFRQATQALIENYAEAYWIDFLEADVVVKMHHQNLTDANEEWEKMKFTAEIAKVNAFLLNNFRYFAQIYEQIYLSEQSALAGLHIVQNKPLTKEDGTVVTFKTTGTISRGHKVELSGDKGALVLSSGAEQEPWEGQWRADDEALKIETGPFRELSNKYTYTLPKGKKLSDISTDGKIKMKVVYQ